MRIVPSVQFSKLNAKQNLQTENFSQLSKFTTSGLFHSTGKSSREKSTFWEQGA